MLTTTRGSSPYCSYCSEDPLVNTSADRLSATPAFELASPCPKYSASGKYLPSLLKPVFIEPRMLYVAVVVRVEKVPEATAIL